MNGVVQCIPDCDVNADTVAWLPKQETFFVNYILIEEKKFVFPIYTTRKKVKTNFYWHART